MMKGTKATTKKATKVNILSDIILKPLRSPTNVNLLDVPPLVSLSNTNKIGKGISSVSDCTNGKTNQTILLLPDGELEKTHPTEESLKRKSFDNSVSQDTPKKSKLTSAIPQVTAVDSNDEETFYNYMTGSFETLAREESTQNTKFLEQNADIKGEITVQEGTIKYEDIITKVEIEDVKNENSKPDIKLVSKEGDSHKSDKKPTVTIDLTDDDDTEANLNVQNNIFIQNVKALQNAITLQNLIKTDSDSKLPNLKPNLVIQNQSSPLKNLENVIIKSPSPILQNSIRINNQNTLNTITPSSVAQPMVLLLQNSPNFVLSQNIVSTSKLVQNGLQQNFVLLPNNLNIQMVGNKQSVVLQNNQSPVKVVESTPQTAVKGNLVTNNTNPKNLSISDKPNTKATGQIQIQKILLLPQGNKLDVGTNNLGKILSPQKSISSPQNPKRFAISLQNSQASLQNVQTSLQNFTCVTCPYKANSKRGLILHIFNKHLKEDYELNLKCKICSFETEFQGVMEKHDLGHGNSPQNQEKFDNVCLSNHVDIQIKPARKKDSHASEKDSRSADADVPVEIVELSDSDEEPSKSKKNCVQEHPTYRCFGCNFSTSKRQSLQNHVVRHFQTKFECSKHQILREDCQECIYKSCLLGLKKNMFLCTKCGYRTCRKQCYESHVRNRCNQGTGKVILYSSDSEPDNDTSNTFRCYHCSFVSESLEPLKYHAIQHFGGAFSCDIHKSQTSASCNKCIYQMILKDLRYVIKSCPCGFKTLDDSKIRQHESKKENCAEFKLKYNGDPHGYNKSISEVALLQQKIQHEDKQSNKKKPVSSKKNINRNSSTAKSKAVRKKVAPSKNQTSDTAVEKKLGDFKCFDCTYVSTSRDLLRMHAVKHSGHSFKCSFHPTSTFINCKVCIYKTLLDELNKKVLSCEGCGFRTLRKITFDRHKSKGENCEKYKKKRLLEEEAEAESDVELRRKRKMLLEKQDIPTLHPEILICAKCHFRASNQETFKLHSKLHENVNNGNNKPNQINQMLNEKMYLNCFDCNEFFTEDRVKLKEHAVLHYKETFSCDNHIPAENVLNCGKCIYFSIKMEITNEIMVCKRCSFKTLQEDVFKQHNSSEYMCNQQENARDRDYNPESDVDLESDSAEEDRDSRQNLVKYNLGRELESLLAPTDVQESGVETESRQDLGGGGGDQTRHRIPSRKTVSAATNVQNSVVETESCGGGSGQTRRRAPSRKTASASTDEQNSVVERESRQNLGGQTRRRAPSRKTASASTDEQNSVVERESRQNLGGQTRRRAPSRKTASASTDEQNSVVERESRQNLGGQTRRRAPSRKTASASTDKQNSVVQTESRQNLGGQTRRRAPRKNASAFTDVQNSVVETDSRQNLGGGGSQTKRRAPSRKTVSAPTFVQDSDIETRPDVNGQVRCRAFEKAVASSTDVQISVVETESRQDLCGEMTNRTCFGTTINNFKCFDCGLECFTLPELENHAVTHQYSTVKCDHPDFADNCKKCVYQYILEKTSENKMLECKCCGYNSDNLEVMRNHMKTTAGCETFGISSSASGSQIRNKIYKCYDCELELTSRQKLWIHSSHHISYYQCSDHADFSQMGCGQCLYALIHKTIRLYYSRCFDCSGRIYTAELDLRDHIENKHAGSDFKCNLHQDKTPEEECDKCRYSYIVSQISKRHLHYCSNCKGSDYPYASWKNLKTHISLEHKHSDTKCVFHINKRPFLECSTCLFEKILSYILSEESKYKCYECPLKRFTKQQLEAHVRIMHEESTFQCTTHSLGDISDKCGMCTYESIVVLMNS